VAERAHQVIAAVAFIIIIILIGFVVYAANLMQG
jgi:hypothetical protein